MVKIVGQTDLSSLGGATSLGAGKLGSNPEHIGAPSLIWKVWLVLHKPFTTINKSPESEVQQFLSLIELLNAVLLAVTWEYVNCTSEVGQDPTWMSVLDKLHLIITL